ncbi:general secretion pathway protein GspN [Pseudomonas sp. v388]|uniref:type II secretion system protein N n=1 Tax=Pseudomonas sp. v388 TaxID=2479849 RepID=UPI000F7B341E|nr:type II secretion system protein N [Pseudomonas sp. v388]RRV10681.1 general secretion pathway protein GspN [Pseudomonas sp. v388]
MTRMSLRFRASTLALSSLAALLIAAVIWLTTSMSQSVTWLPAIQAPHTPRPSGPVAAMPMLADEQLQAAWQRPLFSPDRSPDLAKSVAGATRLEGLSLSGVILDGSAQWALLRNQDKHTVKLKVGDTLDNGWTLSQLTARVATFTRQGQSQSLSLPVLRLPPATSLHTPSSITPPLLSAP